MKVPSGHDTSEFHQSKFLPLVRIILEKLRIFQSKDFCSTKVTEVFCALALIDVTQENKNEKLTNMT